jgi:nicotinamidase-related amidase
VVPGLRPSAGRHRGQRAHWGESGFAHTGLTAPGCVEGTGRWALELAYTVTLVKDATAALTQEHMHAAVELNAQIYAEHVLTTAEVVAALKN